MHRLVQFVFVLCAAVLCGSVQATESIAPYQGRFGRLQPVIAIVGENSGTELTDFVIPYGVLARSGAAQVTTVATRHGLTILPERIAGAPDAPRTMLPALPAAPPGKALDQVLAALAERYGSRTAYRVALEFEYPSYTP